MVIRQKVNTPSNSRQMAFERALSIQRYAATFAIVVTDTDVLLSLLRLLVALTSSGGNFLKDLKA